CARSRARASSTGCSGDERAARRARRPAGVVRLALVAAGRARALAGTRVAAARARCHPGPARALGRAPARLRRWRASARRARHAVAGLAGVDAAVRGRRAPPGAGRGGAAAGVRPRPDAGRGPVRQHGRGGHAPGRPRGRPPHRRQGGALGFPRSSRGRPRRPDRVRPARLRAVPAHPRPRERARPAARQRGRPGGPRNRAGGRHRPGGEAAARAAGRAAGPGAADRRGQHRRPARPGQGRRAGPRTRRAHPCGGLWRRPAGPVRAAHARPHGRDRRGSAAAHRNGHRRPRVPRPRRPGAGGDLRRDRPARTGRAPRTGAAAAGGALPLAARRGAAAGPAGHLAAAAPPASQRRSGRGGAMTDALSQLQFMRPAWLWALLALPLLAAGWYRQRRRAGVWQRHVDPHLLPHLVEPGGSGAGRVGLGVRLLAFALAVFALAGPGWRQDTAVVRQDGRPLVVALELSEAMLTPDLPPSRLLQARAWLAALLDAHEGGVALVVFADDAFTVAPLTDDAANVAIFLDALAPDLMPVDGHRPARAIDHAL